MSFSLLPAVESDISVLANVAHQAFENDAHTLLKVHYGKYNHEKVMMEVLQHWFSRPSHCHSITKAVDNDTNSIIGWVAWGYKRGHIDDDTKSNTGGDAANHIESNDNTVSAPSRTPTATATSDTNQSSSTPKVQGRIFDSETIPSRPLARLESLTSTDLQNWMIKLMPPGTSCMYIKSIAVSPVHQSRGVGTALIRYGTSQADHDSVFCWVHSSDAAWKTFAKEGFSEVGKLTVDLDQVAREEEGDGEDEKEPEAVRSWGQYTFRYMKRLPTMLTPS